MVAPIERIYELALRALDEQERWVTQVRGGMPAILATAGIGLSLLAPPAFDSGHPRGVLEVAAVALGVLGAVAVVGGAVVVLRPLGISFTMIPLSLLASLGHHELDDEPAFYEAATGALADRYRRNDRMGAWLLAAFDVTVLALGLEVVGFGSAAALAS